MAAEPGSGRLVTELLTGWGRTAPSRASVARPAHLEEVHAVLGDPPSRGAIARGLGRSYGDAAQCAGGTVIDVTGMAKVRGFDGERGVVRVDAGISLGELTRLVLPLGWFPPVVPGTRHVTVGGAVAADIHGKNHHVDGSFCDHVEGFTLLTPTGTVEVTPDSEPDLFWATAGGMGLTGVVGEVTIRLQPVETAFVRVDTERACDLDDALARMEEGDHRYRYSVAWIDCLARGASLGRAVLTRGGHASLDDLPVKVRPKALRAEPRVVGTAPPWAPQGLLNQASVRAFNTVWFHRAPSLERGRLQPLHRFFHPLDAVQGWNRVYGERGFVQYQFVVPVGQERALAHAVERLSATRCPSFLAVLKRFGGHNDGPLSFPMAGWTLALDLQVGPPRVGPVLDELDEVVAEAGGRVYLAKDARLRPELLPVMYPRLDEWRRVQAKVDPTGVLRSDLARRLGLVERQGVG
ncbi:MAG TPA: FAD-binding oxidoreductase [Acidimicrobiales bacterium]|nr:FAD-binding oxidoreductase [Acidimicrobiales bacterium]